MPAQPTPEQDGLQGIASLTLRAAAASVVTGIVRDTGGRPEEVTKEVVDLAGLVENGTGCPDGHAASPARVALRRRLLDRLFAEVLEEWARLRVPPAPAEMLDLLRSFQTAREAVETGSDDGSTALLSLGQAPDLVVELAHDLRSPLTSILFLSEAMRAGQSGEVNELQHRQLGIIYGAALNLVSVASDVIELARDGNRLLERQPTPFSISETFTSIRDLVRPVAEERGISLRMLPPAVDRRRGFPVALSRVLLNLTTNGLKFTDEGVVEIMGRAVDATRVEFSVRDTGRGITPEDEVRLFDPFQRYGTDSRFGFSGSGLGLAICRRLVRAMGSELRYDTTPRWGTRFYFELHLPPVEPA